MVSGCKEIGGQMVERGEAIIRKRYVCVCDGMEVVGMFTVCSYALYGDLFSSEFSLSCSD